MPVYFAMFYPAVDMPGAFNVLFPDLEGCATFGENLEDALFQAGGCLDGYLKTCRRLGEAIPKPSGLDEARRLGEELLAELGENAAGAFVQAVRGGSLDEKPLRLSISMPPSLVREVDEAAARSGLTRSGFLAEAARRHVRAPRGTSAPHKTFGAEIPDRK